MTKLMLLSGGIDSAYMVYNEATRYDERIQPVYIDCGQGENKVRAERRNIDKIIEFCSRKGQATVRTYISPNSNFLFGSSRSCLKQTPAWLFGLLELADPSRHSGVYLGYIQGDSICRKLDQVEAAWNALCDAFLDHRIPMLFPLIDKNKMDILSEYDRNSLSELYNTTWTCELPIIENGQIVPCWKCPACATHSAALFTYRRTYGSDLFENHEHQEGTRLYFEMVSHRYDTIPEKRDRPSLRLLSKDDNVSEEIHDAVPADEEA